MDLQYAPALGKLLLEMGVVSQQTLDDVIAAQKNDKRRLGELLVDRGVVRPQQLAQILSHQLSCPWVSLQRVEIGPSVLGLVPRDLALELEVVPVHLRIAEGTRTLYVATADPTDAEVLSICARAAAMAVKPMVAVTSDIRAALARLYGVDEDAHPSAAPKRRPSSEAIVIEDEVISVVESAPQELQRPAILSLNSPPRFLEQCRAAVTPHDGVVVDGSFQKAAELVAAHKPCAIVVTEDVYAFDRSGLNRLALDNDTVLVVWSEDVETKQLEPLLGGAIRRWRRSAYEKGAVLDGRYELLRDLGGPVATSRWEVRHTRTGRRSILHVAATQARPDGEDPTGVKRQQLALARVVHPGALDLRDAGTTERGDAYVIVETLEGKTLEGLIAARGRIPAPDACSVLLQIADVLESAHGVGVLHGDVRPENIVVWADAFGVERAKLAGWQSARVVEGEIDPRSDVLALGLVAFEALVGREPKPDERIDGIDMPADLARALERAIIADPEKRFATVAQLAAAIEKSEPHGREPSNLIEARRARVSRRPAASQANEQRKHHRAPYRTPVRVEVPGFGAVDGRSEDISAGGLFVVTRSKIAMGTQVTVRFALPIDGKVVAETALVKWARDARMGEGADLFAIGVELVAAGPEAKRQIERYVSLMGDDQK